MIHRLLSLSLLVITLSSCTLNDARARHNFTTNTQKLLLTKPAKISAATLKRLDAKYALWRGRVAGDGLTHLELHLSRQGNLVEKRYMGSVYLKNKSTTFQFKSYLPKGEKLEWKIIAYSLQI
jgi:hypothetical protein